MIKVRVDYREIDQSKNTKYPYSSSSLLINFKFKNFILKLGEFDPGLERTLAARLIHASRARRCSNTLVKRRTGEEYMGNLPSSGE